MFRDVFKSIKKNKHNMNKKQWSMMYFNLEYKEDIRV